MVRLLNSSSFLRGTFILRKLSVKELCIVEPLTVGFHAVARGRVTAEDSGGFRLWSITAFTMTCAFEIYFRSFNYKGSPP